jgi:hypothetical protein
MEETNHTTEADVHSRKYALISDFLGLSWRVFIVGKFRYQDGKEEEVFETRQ